MPPALPEEGAGPVAWKRPESVLVVVHTLAGDVLLLERVHPRGFWQSVTGSLEAGERPSQAARRELLEETGIDVEPRDRGSHVDFDIAPAWRHRYAPGVVRNREHLFEVVLEARPVVTLERAEHVGQLWLPRAAALERASSSTNRAAIERLVACGP